MIIGKMIRGSLQWTSTSGAVGAKCHLTFLKEMAPTDSVTDVFEVNSAAGLQAHDQFLNIQ